MIVPWVAAVIAVGLIISGIVIMRVSGLKRRKLFFRDILLGVLIPTLLFIAFIEFVVVPFKGAQYASSLYPIFICWLVPASLLINRRLKKYYS